jgi:hypothetical protein
MPPIQPQYPQSGYGYPFPAPVQVPNLLIPAVIITVLCCPLLGIPAIVYASQANSKAAIGDGYGAQSAANSAKMWCWIAGILGFVVNVFGFVMGIAAQLAKTPGSLGR